MWASMCDGAPASQPGLVGLGPRLGCLVPHGIQAWEWVHGLHLSSACLTAAGLDTASPTAGKRRHSRPAERRKIMEK
eukprot:scaffold8280_cov108-Isochrysis_galbana.AAC.1